MKSCITRESLVESRQLDFSALSVWVMTQRRSMSVQTRAVLYGPGGRRGEKGYFSGYFLREFYK